MLTAYISQSAIPANGRHFGPTNSEIRTNVCITDPGVKNPNTARAKM